MNVTPNTGVPLIDPNAPPLVSHVTTPKVEEVQLRYGQFLAWPLRAPRAHHMNISSVFEGARYLVLKIEPDERPEMAWTKGIKVGDVVSMTDGQHTAIMRLDLTGTPVPMRCASISKIPMIGHVLNLNLGQVLSWVTQPVTEGEFLDVGQVIEMKKKMAEREEMLAQGPNA